MNNTSLFPLYISRKVCWRIELIIREINPKKRETFCEMYAVGFQLRDLNTFFTSTFKLFVYSISDIFNALILFLIQQF